VLRLVSANLEEQELVGRIEAVATGEQTVVRGVDDLLAFTSRAATSTGERSEAA
jgi:hypothetical protein